MTSGIRTVKVQLLKNQSWIADQCVVAESFYHRLKGLIGKRELRRGEGLWLKPCNDIHMWFMSIPIDVIFIRKEILQNKTEVIRVTSVRENLRPWRLFPVRDWRAAETIELPTGTIQRCGISAGDELCIS